MECQFNRKSFNDYKNAINSFSVVTFVLFLILLQHLYKLQDRIVRCVSQVLPIMKLYAIIFDCV